MHLVIQGSNLEIRTISGTEYGRGNYNFSWNLPNRPVNVSVKKTKGRGYVSVIQQPAYFNYFTAIVEVNDNKGGAKEYEIEISW